MEAREVLTPGEVAAMFRVSPKTVTCWAKDGLVPSFRTLGGDHRFYADDIKALLVDTPARPHSGRATEAEEGAS